MSRRNIYTQLFKSIVSVLLILTFPTTNLVWATPVERDMPVTTLSPPSFSADPDAYTQWFTRYMLAEGIDSFQKMSVPAASKYLNKLDHIAKAGLAGVKLNSCVSWDEGERNLYIFLSDSDNVRLLRFFSPTPRGGEDVPLNGLSKMQFHFSDGKELFNKYLQFEVLKPVNPSQKALLRTWMSLEELYQNRLYIGSEEPRDTLSMSHRFKKASAVIKQAAVLNNLKRKKKQIFLDVFLPHMTVMGGDGRRGLSEGMLAELYNDFDTVTRRLLLEAMVEAFALGEKNAKSDLKMNVFRLLVRDEDNPNFAEDLVDLYSDGLSKSLHLLEINYYDFENALINIIQKLSDDNPMFISRITKVFSDYGNYAGESFLDLSEAEKEGIDRFVTRLGEMEGFDVGDMSRAKVFSETYFYMTLEDAIKSGFISRKVEVYHLTGRGVDFLEQEMLHGLMTYPEALEFSHEYLPELSLELITFYGYEQDKKLIENIRSFRHEIAGWICALENSMSLIKTSPGAEKHSDQLGDIDLLFSEIKKMFLKMERAKKVLMDLLEEEEVMLVEHPLPIEKFQERRKRFARVMDMLLTSSNRMHYYFLTALEVDYESLMIGLPEDLSFIPVLMHKKLRDASCKTYNFTKARGGIDSLRDVQEHDLNQVIELEAKAFIVSGGEVKLELGDIPTIEADSTLLTEIVTNLMKNGLDAMDWEKHIFVRTLYDAARKEVVIEFVDTGGGIPEDLKDKIFDRDVSTKKSKGGTGLGLDITKRIVEEFDGTISFESEVGKGTTFTVRFPAKIDDEDDSKEIKPQIEWKEYQEKAGLANGLSAVLREGSLQKGWFSRKQFKQHFKGKGARRETYSDRDVAITLEALAKLGALQKKKPKRKRQAITYKITPSYLKYDEGTTGTIKKVLSVLLTRPDDIKIAEVRDKIEKQITGNGNDMIFYYQRSLPRSRIRLLAFDRKKALLERQLKKDPSDAGLKAKYAKCMDDFEYLKDFLQSEIDLLSPADYDVERTGGINYREIAKGHLVKVLEYAMSGDIQRSIKEIDSAKDAFDQEFKSLYGSGVMVKKPYVREDVQNSLYQILNGYYHKHTLRDGRELPVREQDYGSSTERLQSIRSLDRKIDGNLAEMDWLVENGKVLNEVIALLQLKINNGQGLSEVELRSIEEIIRSQEGKYRYADNDVKVGARAGMIEAKEALEDRDLEGLLTFVVIVRDLFRERYANNRGIIKNTRNRALRAARQGFLARNWRLREKLNKILYLLDNNPKKANGLIMDLVTHESEIKKSSEFNHMFGNLWGASDAITKQNDIALAKSYVEEVSRRMYLEEFLNDFMPRLRGHYVDRRMKQAPEGDYDRVFSEIFNIHLKVAKENNVGRGSPRLLLAYYYLFAYVSIHMIKPGTKTVKIDNPVFAALKDLVYMLEVDDVSVLRSYFEGRHLANPNLYIAFVGFLFRGLSSVSEFSKADYMVLLEELAKDHNVPESKMPELMRIAGILNSTMTLSDVKDLDIYWNAIWEQYEKNIEGSVSSEIQNEAYREFIDFSIEPEKWNEDFVEDWEEDFVEDIAYLSANVLAEKFMGYYSQETSFVHEMKDLRKVKKVMGGIDNTASLTDIFPNICGLIPLDRKYMTKTQVEMMWILREWIYRHYDNTFKENSYERVIRGQVRKLMPMIDFASMNAHLISWQLEEIKEVKGYGAMYSVGDDGRITFTLEEEGDIEFGQMLQRAADLMFNQMNDLEIKGLLPRQVKDDIVRDIKRTASPGRAPPIVKVAKDFVYTSAKEPDTNTVWINDEWNRMFLKYAKDPRFGRVVTALLSERLYHEIPHHVSETMQTVRDIYYLQYIDEEFQQEIEAFFDLQDVKESGISHYTKARYKEIMEWRSETGPSAENILTLSKLFNAMALDNGVTAPVSGRRIQPMVAVPYEEEAPVYGGKGYWTRRLAELSKEIGFKVIPSEFITIQEAWSKFIEGNRDLIDEGNKLIKEDVALYGHISQDTEKRLSWLMQRLELPKEVEEMINKHGTDFWGRLIERSSGSMEDGYSQNLAGVLISPVIEDKKLLVQGVKQVFMDAARTIWIDSKTEDYEIKGVPASLDPENGFAIVVQPFLNFETSGTAMTTLYGHTTIEAVIGDAVTAVTGEYANTTQYVFKKGSADAPDIDQLFLNTPHDFSLKGKKYSVKDNRDELEEMLTKYPKINGKVSPISHEQAKEIDRVINVLEDEVGAPLDVEWGFLDGRLYIIQIRPIIAEFDGELIDMAEGLKEKIPIAETPVALGKTDPEGFRGKMVVFGETVTNKDIKEFESDLGDPYIRVQFDVASKILSGTTTAKVIVDPRQGSRSAHNVNLIDDRIGSGEFVYVNGPVIKSGLIEGVNYLRHPKYSDIWVSVEDVICFSNGLRASFFAKKGKVDRSDFSDEALNESGRLAFLVELYKGGIIDVDSDAKDKIHSVLAAFRISRPVLIEKFALNGGEIEDQVAGFVSEVEKRALDLTTDIEKIQVMKKILDMPIWPDAWEDHLFDGFRRVIDLVDLYSKESLKRDVEKQQFLREIASPRELKRPERLRVLYINDDMTSRRTKASVFPKQMGMTKESESHYVGDEFEAFIASSREEAFKVLDEQDIDYVITDWVLPDGDGSAVIEEAIRTGVAYIDIDSATSEYVKYAVKKYGGFNIGQYPNNVKEEAFRIKEFRQKQVDAYEEELRKGAGMAKPVNPGKLNVLIAGDDHAETLLLRKRIEMVNDDNVNVVIVTNVEDAIAVIKENRIEVVFADFFLPMEEKHGYGSGSEYDEFNKDLILHEALTKGWLEGYDVELNVASASFRPGNKGSRERNLEIKYPGLCTWGFDPESCKEIALMLKKLEQGRRESYERAFANWSALKEVEVSPSLKVLCVDNAEYVIGDIKAFVRHFLDDNQYDFDYASDVDETIDKITMGGYDVVLFDVGVPIGSDEDQLALEQALMMVPNRIVHSNLNEEEVKRILPPQLVDGQLIVEKLYDLKDKVIPVLKQILQDKIEKNDLVETKPGRSETGVKDTVFVVDQYPGEANDLAGFIREEVQGAVEVVSLDSIWALKRALKKHVPGLVVTDNMLDGRPALDEIFSIVKKANPNVRFVVASDEAAIMPEDVKRRSDVVAIVETPFHSAKVVSIVKDELSRLADKVAIEDFSSDPEYDLLFWEEVIQKSVKDTLPGLTFALQSAASKQEGGQFRIIIDSKLGRGRNKVFINKVRDSLNKLALRNDLLGEMIRNVDFRAADVSKLSDSERRAGLIIASMDHSNDDMLNALDGTTSILRLDDKGFAEDYYYPATEIIFFGLARALGYDRGKLEKIFQSIPNIDVDDIDGAMLADGNANKMMIIRIVPDAVKWPEGKLSSWITDYILSNA